MLSIYINKMEILNQYNLPLSVSKAIMEIRHKKIKIEKVKEDFIFIRKIERAFSELFKKYVESGQIVLSKRTNYYSIKGYKKRGEVGTIMAIRYMINMLKYEYKIYEYDLIKYKSLVCNYFCIGTRNEFWFEYNQYNMYKYSLYYKDWEYIYPTKKFIYYTDNKYYKIIKKHID